MIEGMTPDQIENQEKLNSGTSRTNNEQFDKNGYLIVKNLWEAEELFRPVPEERGQINYWGKGHSTDVLNNEVDLIAREAANS